MSDIHKCGFFGILASLLRRAMCVGTRRGSNDSCYRELDDQEARYGTVGSDSTPSTDPDNSDESGQKTFGEVVAAVTIEDVANAKNQKKPIGSFKSFKKGPRKGAGSSGQGEKKFDAYLDDSYPLNVRLLLAKSTTWEFDTHELDRATGGRCLPTLCMHLFTGYGLISFFKLSPETCWKLFRTIEDNYHNSNLYHNSLHAADVTQAVHCFLQQPRLLKFMNPMEILVVLLAAITHDLDHPGVNHSFLVATKHPLAIIFKDKDYGMDDRTPFPSRKKRSRRLQEMIVALAAQRAESSDLDSSSEMRRPSSSMSTASKNEQDNVRNLTRPPCESILEHHHWRMAYSCILESGLFAHMPELLPEIKSKLRSLILATDITKQDLYLDVFKGHLTRKTLDMSRAEHRHIVLQMALKTADISNPGRPWIISNKWSQKVCSEFFKQGDEEMALKLNISKLCNRNIDSVPEIQKGFYRYIVMPLYAAWHQFLKSGLSQTMIVNLVHNEAEWARKEARSVLTSSKITDADDHEIDLDTSTYMSGGSEMLFRTSLGSDASSSTTRMNRRSSHSPLQRSSIKEAIRRYSAPLQQIFSEPRPRIRPRSSISEVRLVEDLRGYTGNMLMRNKPQRVMSMYEIVIAVMKSQELARKASVVPPAHVAQEQELEKEGGDSSTRRFQCVEHTPELDSDDEETSSEERVHKKIGSVIIEESATSSGSQLTGSNSNGKGNHLLQPLLSAVSSSAPSSAGRLDRLLEEGTPVPKTAASSCNMITFTPVKKAVGEITLPQLIISEPYHRRRGSAPAPITVSELQRLASNLSLQLELRKNSVSSCHQIVAVEGAPAGGFARRGSLPVEASPQSEEKKE